MHILRLEVPVRDYNEWKTDFDRDPVGREKHGVLRYRIATKSGNRNFVCVDMEINTKEEAEQLLAEVKSFWRTIADKLPVEPNTAIYQIEEEKELRSNETTNPVRA